MFGLDDLAILAASAYANYAANKKGSPTAPPPPSNYFNTDGSFQVWDPATNSYTSMGARTSPQMLGNNAQSYLLMNQMLGGNGYGDTRAAMQREIEDLKSSYAYGADPRAGQEIISRIKDLTNAMNNMKDVPTGYDAIGVTNPTKMLQFRGTTDTINKYLTDTLDQGFHTASDAQASSMANRGMAQSSMSDWGQNEMARKYATDKTGVAIQSEDYFRQLRTADEQAKMGILSAAEGGLGTNASIQAGVNSASQAQMNLAQQLASYNSNLQNSYNQSRDAWSNQQNQNVWSTLAGVGKMAAGGYYGGTAGMLGAPATMWSTGWGGTNYNPNSGGQTTSNSGVGSIGDFWKVKG